MCVSMCKGVHLCVACLNRNISACMHDCICVCCYAKAALWNSKPLIPSALPDHTNDADDPFLSTGGTARVRELLEGSIGQMSGMEAEVSTMCTVATQFSPKNIPRLGATVCVCVCLCGRVRLSAERILRCCANGTDLATARRWAACNHVPKSHNRCALCNELAILESSTLS